MRGIGPGMIVRHEEYRAIYGRGGGRRGFSPLGFVLLLALMVGFLGQFVTGLVIGSVLVLIVLGYIARNAGSVKHVRPRSAMVGSQPPGVEDYSNVHQAVVPVQTQCLCGSTTHATVDHAESGPHGKVTEDRFNSALATELLSGRITVKRR